jgi:large subunit ribosomal protein L25
MADLELRAERRAVVGKKVRGLRRQGLLPANVYGPGVESTALQLPARETEATLRRVTASTLLGLVVDGAAPRQVLVRHVQRHPVGDQALHIDFFAVAMDQTMRTAVPLHFVGEAPAVAQFEGTLVHNLDAIEVECLPGDLPERVEVDLTGLAELHSMLHVRDLVVPERVTVLTAPDTSVAAVLPPSLAVEAVEAAEAPAAETAAEPAPEAEGPPEAAGSEEPTP